MVSSGSVEEAASSKVRFKLATLLPLPASDISTTFWPAGPTSNMSTSAGQVWLKPWSCTVTLFTKPETLATVMWLV